MRNVWNDALRRNGQAMAFRKSFYRAYSFSFTTLTAMLFILAGCVKEARENAPGDAPAMHSLKANEASNVVNLYTGLSFQTAWELQQAHAATAKYKNISNALKDNYVDIGVVAPNMGYHFMREEIVDAKFDFKSPEILVYNKDEKGIFYLVAVEYAVPLTEQRPAGFTGTGDVWDDSSGFPLWLLHAWVWSYNPDGVFNPTNPLVHLH